MEIMLKNDFKSSTNSQSIISSKINWSFIQETLLKSCNIFPPKMLCKGEDTMIRTTFSISNDPYN